MRSGWRIAAAVTGALAVLAGCSAPEPAARVDTTAPPGSTAGASGNAAGATTVPSGGASSADDTTEPTTEGQATLFLTEALARRERQGLTPLTEDPTLTNAAKELTRRYLTSGDTDEVFGGLDDVLSPRDTRVLSMWIWCNDATPANRCGGTLGELADYIGPQSAAATTFGRAQAIQGSRWIVVVLAGAEAPDAVGLGAFADEFGTRIDAARRTDTSLSAAQRSADLDAIARDLTDAWATGRDLSTSDPALADQLDCDQLAWAFWGHGAATQPTVDDVVRRAENDPTSGWSLLLRTGQLQYGVASGPFRHTLWSAVLLCLKPATLR